MLPELLLIAPQNAIDDPAWGTDRNTPGAEGNMAMLLAEWRARGWPRFLVKHVSREPQSTYRPGQPGCDFKTEVAPREGDHVIEKSTNSAFIGTTLEAGLRALGVTDVVITRVITNNSVEATARMSGNLRLPTIVVRDATATLGRHDYAGTWRTAGE